MELSTRYEPQATEADIYQKWMDANAFRSTPDEREKYCITVPPPNVTGALHMGHALNHTIMDVLGRWKRMLGYNTLILPGTDHGGISTQAVVERELKKQGISRHDLGREKFVERVWEWKDEYGSRILSQLKSLGCGYDWERLYFTMDEPYVNGIMTVFAKLYDDGLIYLGERIVNWSPPLMTTISDIEVDNRELEGSLWHIRYPFTDGSGSVTVATTRPETMLGDTAVAVNPKDERYLAQIGKTITLPLTGREIPLIGDDFVEPTFGTGAVKVTPFHDANDYEAGLRHNLPRIEVIGPDAKMTENAGEYAGLDRFEARKRIVAALEEQGFLVKIEPYRHVVGHCDRSGAIIEPRVSHQWFCKMAGTSLVDAAIRDAETENIRFVPGRYKDVFLRWMENIREWPISRGLWWGHRMPLWRKTDSNPKEQASYVVAMSRDEAVTKLGSEDILQVDEVLDTWFSSALWPFATLGWPSESEEAKRDLAYYYPTDALFTAQEIIFLWVARMIMTGEEFVGAKPFDDVYIHATILDEHGRRMSKSKGNGIDPVEMIELYGADALRFSLAREAGQRQDIRFKPVKYTIKEENGEEVKIGKQEQVEQARNFANKIWNASRFALMNLEGYTPPADAPKPTALVDRWILSRLDRTAEIVNEGLATYNLDDASRALYEFFWDDFCDWYIEAAKPRFTGAEAEQAKHVLWFTLERTLRLLHPVMPFLTETIWQNLPGAKEQAGVDFLMNAPFPTPGIAPRDAQAETEWELVQEVTRAIRTLRAENNLKGTGEAFFDPNDDITRSIAASNADIISFLARANPLNFAFGPSDGFLSPTRYGDVRVPRPQASADELQAEKNRIEKEFAKIDKNLAGLAGRLTDEKFLSSAPEAVVSKAKGQQAELLDKQAKLTGRLGEL